MTFLGPFTDLDPTDADLDDLAEVLGEVDAEEAAGMLGDGEDYGPWDDQAQLSADEIEAIKLARAVDRLSRQPYVLSVFGCPNVHPLSAR